jgi:hypothetical protein
MKRETRTCTTRPPARGAPDYAGRLLLFLTALFPLLTHAAIRISEFVAENDAGLRTAAGEASDWIELYNDATNSVDLGGWYLTDKASAPTKWRIPDSTLIASNGYLVIFADSSNVSLTNGELHASFSLSKDGEYLGLIEPDGATVADAFAPQFPKQFKDVSYGRAAREHERVGAGTPARYRVPNAEDTAEWTAATGALGFCGTNAAFTVRYYEMSGAIANVDSAETMVANSSYWKTDRAYPIVGDYVTVDFHESSASGYFTNNLLFPGLLSGQNKSYYVVVSESAIYIPEAGQWTFCVGSDDGFRLRITGHGVNFTSEFATGRGFGTTLATFTFPVAGVYSLSLVYFENTGGATEEFSVAKGYQSAFSLDTFHLVGDPASGVLHAGAIGAFIETDVSPPLLNVNARLDAEWTFSQPDIPAANDTVTLLVRCADGFKASLNGTHLASLNLPSPLLWNSASTAARPLAEVLQWLSFPVPVAAFVSGTNTLALTGLNDAATNTEFLLQPRLVWRTAEQFPCYFSTPTPGAANGQARTAPTPKVTASEPRGYKTAPFSVSLTCEDDANAVIRYTLDGNTPGTNSPVYTGPLTVTNTTVLRAAVVDTEALRINVKTVTWLFLEDILRQGATPPPGWPANQAVNAQVMEYGLRQDIVDADPARVRNAMTNAIPSLSLVTDLTNLFSAASGIYVNPSQDGIDWERPVAVELIDPVRGSNYEFRIDAGMRIRGAFSRTTGNPKHALRLFFRSAYGESKLNFKLFDDEGADEFDKVDLRCSQNYSWSYQNSTLETAVRETFSRDTQRDMGMPYTRSRYYHLYLNGQYWGLYQTQERGDADFAETYLGDGCEDWDCIKTTTPGYTTTASDGTFDAFYALHDLAVNQGFSGAYSNNYWRARGLNPDGTANTNETAYLDQDNLIAFMLCAYYTGDPDSPISIWGGFPNNMYGLFNRKRPDGFKWLRHDAEHSLGANGGYPVTCDTTYAGEGFTSQTLFNPGTLHQRLCAHPDYRMRFADLVRKHLYGAGALTPTNAQMRFRSRMNEIDLAIIGESARWGRGKTRDAHWLPACNSVLNTYLAQRRDIIVSHFRNHGWYPWLNAPAFSTNDAAVPTGYTLRVSATNTFYYTTDGSDPRLPGGGINPRAHVVTQAVAQAAGSVTLVPRGATWRYFDLGAEPAVTNGLTWSDPGFPDAAWGQGPAILGIAGSATANAVSTVTRRYVNGVSGTQVVTTYFRHAFALDDADGVTALLVDILRDDGAVVYLNGTEILRETMPAGTPAYSTWSASTVGSPDQNTYFTRSVGAAGLLRAGTNIIAVEVHQCNANSSDLYLDLSLTAVTGGGADGSCHADLIVTNALTVLSRGFDGTDWSPLAEVALSVFRPPAYYAPLRVSELMYAPPSPEAGNPYDNDDFAWLELRNTGTDMLNLEGVRFVAGITHTFESRTLGPGERLVLAKNPEAFSTRYATNGLALAAWTSGNLARKGETLALWNPDGTNLLTFTYSNAWYPETYNTGLSLVAVDLGSDEPLWSTAGNWRPSRSVYGSPGQPDAPRFTAAVLAGGAASLTLSTEGLEGTIETWYSDDLASWVLCPPSSWSREGDLLTVNLLALPPSPTRFFQLRLRD